MTTETATPIEILLVEDNPGDVELTRMTLRRSKLFCNVAVAENGVEALEYLEKTSVENGPLPPDLILLDLNLPKLNGHEVLGRIKAEPAWRKIPVVIVTSSQADEDIARSYDHYANCYVTKPIDLDQFRKVVKSIEDFWFTVVKLPPKDSVS